MKNINTLKSLSEKVTCNFFISMLNPKYRGPNFKFETFGIGEFCVSMISLNRKLSAEEENHVKEFAEHEWKRVINDVGDALAKLV